MASIIKNQILKHLSKFTKNLSPDKINVSTLKGEGELSNLELDERVLMEVSDLPTWLQLRRAVCNRVSIRIQWTKLKTQPICVYLDEIIVDMETCDKPREPVSVSTVINANASSKYGFVERIMDGMYVSINSVSINFKSPSFFSSIQISRILIGSKMPTWQVTNDLRNTRVKDECRGEILIFKEVEWQTLRIEANALEGGADPHLATTPLRLIANQSKTRISLRKRLSDGGIIATRVQLNLDDLLWVLTDTQLKAAILFVNSLRHIITLSTQQSKQLATEKLKKQGHIPSAHQVRTTSKPTTKSQMAMAKMFDRYDVVETSYHVNTCRIDLHLCDDSAPEDETFKKKVEGGAMQLTFHKLSFDMYPFHKGGADRSHWVRYDENMTARNGWAQDLLSAFRDDVRKVRQAIVLTPPSTPDLNQRALKNQTSSSSQNPPSRQTRTSTKLLETCTVVRLEDFTLYRVSTASDSKRQVPKKFIASDKKQLLLPTEMSSVHIEYTEYYFPDGIEYPVPSPNLFMMINPVRVYLDYLSTIWIHAFGTNILKNLDLPKQDTPKIHVDVKLDALMPRIIIPSDNPVIGQADRPDGLQIQVSHVTMSNCHVENKTSMYELGRILLQFEKNKLFSSKQFPNEKRDLNPLPSNFRKHYDHDDDSYLIRPVRDMLHGNGRFLNNFPVEKTERERRGSGSSTTSLNHPVFTSDMLKKDGAKDVWCISIDQFWVDFIGVPSSRTRPVPFIESFPLTVWLCMPIIAAESNAQRDIAMGLKMCNTTRYSNVSEQKYLQDQVPASYNAAIETELASSPSSSPSPVPRLRSKVNKQLLRSASRDDEGSIECPISVVESCAGFSEQEVGDIHLMVEVGGRVALEINHYQFLFLMRLVETVSHFMEEMLEDAKAIFRPDEVPVKKYIVSVIAPHVEAALVCPPIPDGSSLDDLVTSPSLPEDLGKMPERLNSLREEYSFDSKPVEDINEHYSNHLDCHSPTSPLNKSLSDTDIMSHDLSTAADLYAGQNGANQSFSNCDVQFGNHNSSTTHLANLDNNYQQMSASPRIDMFQNDGSVSMTMGGNSYNQSYSPTNASMTSNSQGVRQMSNSLTSLTMTDSDLLNRERLSGKQQDIKKSFNSAMSSLTRMTERVKQNVKKDLLDINDIVHKPFTADDWETMSMRSGTSDDDEEYEILKFQNQEEMPAFDRPRRQSESTSTETGEDRELDAQLDFGQSSGMVSVISFHLAGVSTVIQSIGEDVSVSLAIDHVIPQEYGNVNHSRFHSRFIQELEGSKLIDVKDLPVIDDAPVCMRYMVGPQAEKLAPGAGQLGFLHLNVKGFRTALQMSSVTSLTDLIEDEVIPKPMPLLIEVSDTLITLQKHVKLNRQLPRNRNDAPPTHPTCPGVVPLDLKINAIDVWREIDGAFQVAPGGKAPIGNHLATTNMASMLGPSAEEELQTELSAVRAENDHLREYIAELERRGPRPSPRERSPSTRPCDWQGASIGHVEFFKTQEKKYDETKHELKKVKQLLHDEEQRSSMLTQERESLLLTIQMLQSELREDLTASEHLRGRRLSSKHHKN